MPAFSQHLSSPGGGRGLLLGWWAGRRFGDKAWQSPGIPPAPRTRSPAVPTFQGPSQFSKYVSHKNKISDSDALRSPVPAVHNSFTVSIAHYSHIPPAELSISSLAKLESESWESSEVAVVWVCHFSFFFFFPHSFFDCPARNVTFILCLQMWAA